MQWHTEIDDTPTLAGVDSETPLVAREHVSNVDGRKKRLDQATTRNKQAKNADSL